jgi:hypothetical protein
MLVVASMVLASCTATDRDEPRHLPLEEYASTVEIGTTTDVSVREALGSPALSEARERGMTVWVYRSLIEEGRRSLLGLSAGAWCFQPAAGAAGQGKRTASPLPRRHCEQLRTA